MRERAKFHFARGYGLAAAFVAAQSLAADAPIKWVFRFGVTTRKCQNCPVRENPKGTILSVAREFAPLERLEDTAEGHLVVAPSEKRPRLISIAKQGSSVDRHLRHLRAP